jgi:hypothetical protein
MFDAGQGPRLGHVRRNHIADVAALDAALPRDREGLAAAGPGVHDRLAVVADSCPLPSMMVRRDAVRVLDEWDA